MFLGVSLSLCMGDKTQGARTPPRKVSLTSPTDHVAKRTFAEYGTAYPEAPGNKRPNDPQAVVNVDEDASLAALVLPVAASLLLDTAAVVPWVDPRRYYPKC